MRKLIFLSFATLSIFLASCSSNNTKEQETKEEKVLSGTILIDGSSTVYPITEAVAEEFRAVAEQVKVTIGISGTGGGFKKFAAGETDINDASRPIKEKENDICKEHNITFVELMIAYDGMAIVVNPQNDWAKDITVEELKKLWEPAAEGKIMKWSDVRKTWPKEKITLYGADAASGTYDYFTEAIVGEAGKSRADYTNSSDDNVLVQGVSTDKFALGFFGMAYYEENISKLKVVPVDPGTGTPVTPTIETVSSNTYKPLSRPIFIYVNNKSVQRPEVVKFVEFYLQNCGKLAKDVGYVPLAADLYTKEAEKFKQFVAANAKKEEEVKK